MRRINQKELWLTNISTKKDVSIGDLRLTIRRGKSVNVLDSKHYSYTEEQIQKSIENGSLYKRRDVIKVREVAPIQFKKILMKDNNYVARPLRSSITVEEKYYEDLDLFNDNLTVEHLAEENANAEFQDHKPLLAVDKSFDEEPDEG